MSDQRSKYLTYKEWKLHCRVVFCSVHTKVASVSTLPIRNGNWKMFPIRAPNESLSKYLTYKEWKLLETLDVININSG